ncbi:MAG: hypothetical protein JSS57_23240 [Proteobacteria bacterium]|nr:hypothetical protein [Pseudomonadota bacterium]
MTGLLFTSASVLTFAAIDRLWGAPKGKTPAKILAGASIATLFLIDWKLAAMGAAIVIGRSIGFADGVTTGKNFKGLVLRSIAPQAMAYFFTGMDWMASAALIPHAVVTMWLADWYGKRIDQEPWNVQRALDDNTKVELIRGAFAGLGVGLYAMVRGLV